MRKYDATKCLRQRFHRPNILPLANVLLIVLVTMYLAASSMGNNTPGVDIPDAVNSDYEPLNVFPEIFIMKNGDVVFDGRSIEDLARLPEFIEYAMEKIQPPENKVHLTIHRDVSYGKVQEVLRFVKKAKMETVGFITIQNATLEHLWATPGMQYWWKYEAI